MLKINLLPIKQLKKRAAAINQLIVGGLAILILIFFLGFSGYVQSTIANGIREDIAELESVKKKNEPILKEIQTFKQKKAELDRRIAVIDKLKSTSGLAVRIMDEVAKSVDNSRMWLVSLKHSGMSLSMKGMALDNKSIADFMKTLENSPYIDRKSINLGDSTMKRMAGKELKSFTLSCNVTTPNNDKAQANSKKK